MHFTLDIEEFSSPVIEQSDKLYFYSHSFFKHLPFLSLMAKRKVDLHLAKFIRIIENYTYSIDHLTMRTKEIELQSTNLVISQLIVCSEKLAKIDYIGDEDFRNNFKNCLIILFKIQCELHKSVYINRPIMKTSTELIAGLARMNSKNINQILST